MWTCDLGSGKGVPVNGSSAKWEFGVEGARKVLGQNHACISGKKRWEPVCARGFLFPQCSPQYEPIAMPPCPATLDLDSTWVYKGFRLPWQGLCHGDCCPHLKNGRLPFSSNTLIRKLIKNQAVEQIWQWNPILIKSSEIPLLSKYFLCGVAYILKCMSGWDDGLWGARSY